MPAAAPIGTKLFEVVCLHLHAYAFSSLSFLRLLLPASLPTYALGRVSRTLEAVSQ